MYSRLYILCNVKKKNKQGTEYYHVSNIMKDQGEVEHQGRDQFNI